MLMQFMLYIKVTVSLLHGTCTCTEWTNPWDQFWSVNHMKKQVKKAKESSSNPGVRFLKLTEVLCGSCKIYNNNNYIDLFVVHNACLL